MKKVLMVLLMAILAGSFPAQAAKPLSPLQVNISPAQAGISPAKIKPGEIVELRVIARAFVDASGLGIKVELMDGVELVSGETAWNGSLKNGGEKVLLITVRSPKHGGGGVRALTWMSPSIGAKFFAEAEFRLGKNAVNKPAPAPEIKKDHKGREIREYRIK